MYDKELKILILDDVITDAPGVTVKSASREAPFAKLAKLNAMPSSTSPKTN